MRLRCVLLALVLLAGGCGEERAEPSESGAPATDRPSVYVVNYPLQYFAERMGGELVEVHFPAPRDVDPAYWSPDPDTIAGYQSADVILLNGAGYARWVNHASLPRTRMVYTSAGFAEDYIDVEQTVTHTHGPGAEHSHRGTAFTTWLKPTLAIQQAEAVRDALTGLRPEHEETFRFAMSRLEAQLMSVDDRLSAAAQKLAGRPVIFSHPVYQYLIAGYRLNARSVHWEPDQMPDETQWEELRELLGNHPAKLMIWEAQPLAATRERLEEIGIASVVFDPCAHVCEGGYVKVMQQNAEALEAAISPPP